MKKNMNYYECKAKDIPISLRMNSGLLGKVKEKARVEGIPYQRLIRILLETSLK